MRPSRRILGSLVLAPVLAIALAANTLGSGPFSFVLTGSETSLTTTQAWCSALEPGIPSDVSTFAGVATTTGDSGTWSAKICHSHLTTTTATIYGGSFSYTGTTLPSIVGNFNNGGTVTQTSGFSGCTKQTYRVNGTLDVGSFTAVLTHYRTKLFGRWCIVYAATVTGTADLTFP